MRKLILTAALILATTAQAYAAPEHFNLWNYPATPHNDISQFKSWESVMKREAAMPDTIEVKGWKKFLASISPAETNIGKLELVNNYFNSLHYHTEAELYGKYNYWADVQEFLIRGGDCKGYAMGKYFSLLQLGFTPKDMAVIVLLDQQKNELHAVLAVFQGEEIFILDNQDEEIRKAGEIRHFYFPIYAITAGHYWTFQ